MKNNMKKLIVFLALMVFTIGMFAQIPGEVVSSASAKFKKIHRAGELIINSATRSQYLVLAGKIVGTKDDITGALAGTPKIAMMAFTTGGAYVDTLNAQNVRGVKTFYKPMAFTLGSGTNNVGLGTGCMFSLTSGEENVSIGANSMWTNTTGSENTALGSASLKDNTTGTYNTGVGFRSLYKNTTAGYNTTVGAESLRENTTGAQNTSLGSYSLYDNTSGSYNVAVGYGALQKKTTGDYNSCFGFSSGYGIKTGSGNIAIGKNSGPAGTTSTLSDRLYISNKVGGTDTAIIYGVMGATPAASTLQFNASVHVNQQAGTANTALFQNDKTTAGDSSVVINKLGYVGIGKATATVPLDVVGAAEISGTARIKGAITADVLPSYTIAAGELIPVLAADTIGVAIAGLTTSSKVIVGYGEPVPTADTIACVYSVKAGWLTVIGENGKKINYWVPKK